MNHEAAKCTTRGTESFTAFSKPSPSSKKQNQCKSVSVCFKATNN